MPLIALALLLFAATLHTTWNLLVKKATQRQVFIWLALSSGAIGSVLFVLTTTSLTINFSLQAWFFIVPSTIAEVIYYLMLIRAYAIGDFSLVYPFARGTAPIFLFVWTNLFLGERATLAGIVGLLLIVTGLFAVGAKTLLVCLQQKTSWQGTGLSFALAASLCISIYTAIDGAAVRTTAPLQYTIAIFALTAISLTPFVLLNYSPKMVAKEWQTNWWRILIVGAMNIITYVLVLEAYSLAKVSYAGAIREISIVFAAFVGWKWLGETFDKFRLFGAFSIFVGIIVLATIG